MWSLDDQDYANLGNCHGLIFLFKMIKEDETSQVVKDDRLDDLFFAKQVKITENSCKSSLTIVVYFSCRPQVIHNACATQAILSVLLNVKHPDLQLGDTLSEFKEFTQSFDAFNKGL